MVAAKVREIYDREAKERMDSGKGHGGSGGRGKKNPVATLPQGLPEGSGKSRDIAGATVGVGGTTVDKATKDEAGKWTVTVNGVDIFDPNTGEIRSSGPDDIATWFIDTDYDGKSFFLRHAYFLGAQEPYERLKKALKAEIDEGEWSKLYGAISVPFDPPKDGEDRREGCESLRG